MQQVEVTHSGAAKSSQNAVSFGTILDSKNAANNVNSLMQSILQCNSCTLNLNYPHSLRTSFTLKSLFVCLSSKNLHVHSGQTKEQFIPCSAFTLSSNATVFSSTLATTGTTWFLRIGLGSRFAPNDFNILAFADPNTADDESCKA